MSGDDLGVHVTFVCNFLSLTRDSTARSPTHTPPTLKGRGEEMERNRHSALVAKKRKSESASFRGQSKVLPSFASVACFA